MSAIPTLILYVPAICWLEFSVCKPSAKNLHKISQFCWWCKCKMCHCFEICNIFIIVLIFEGDSPSHFDTVTKKLIWIQISKVTCLLISPLFRKFWFHLKIWRQFTIMFCHWLSSIVDFTSTLEVDSPSYFAFVLKTLILLWISKTVHIIVFCYCSACLRFRPLFLDSSGATFAFAPNSFFSSSATFGKLFKKK